VAPALEGVDQLVDLDIPQLQRPLAASKQHLVQVCAGMKHCRHLEAGIAELNLRVLTCKMIIN